MTDRGNRRTLVPLCPPQIQQDLKRARTQAAEVGSRQMSSSAAGTTSCCVQLLQLHVPCYPIIQPPSSVKFKDNGVLWDVTPCGSYKTDVSEELSS
jgi:hypothetical protein